MAPQLRIDELKRHLAKGKAPNKAGVMALFYPDRDWQTHLVLILRNTYPGVHSNQIGFPGGKQEEGDKDMLQTAIRETNEEIGVPTPGIKVVRALSEIYIPPSNFEVYPFLGLYEETFSFEIQESEVAELLEVRLTDFMDDKKMITQNLTTSYAENIEVPAFMLNGHVVWGATAMMLSEIKELFKQVL